MEENKYKFELEEVSDEEDLEETYDISYRILAIDDELSKDIVMQNIEGHINNTTSLDNRYNYITEFKERINKVEFEEEQIKDYVVKTIEELSDFVLKGLEEKYKITIGTAPEDDVDIFKYLDKVETLYEFFFVRNKEHITDYLYKTIIKEKDSYVAKYKERYQDEEDSDLFVTQDKKKFKNFSDVIITNYLTDIIYDIAASNHSAYILFRKIVDLDLYELFNSKMSDLLMDYGVSFICQNDEEAAAAYLSILDDKNVFTDIRNDIFLKLTEGAEPVNEELNQY